MPAGLNTASTVAPSRSSSATVACSTGDGLWSSGSRSDLAAERPGIRRHARRASGRAVEPYLGARGHLVALRSSDLAYLHVHPTQTAARPGQVAFATRFPSALRVGTRAYKYDTPPR